jgi:hypothetical protein
MSHFTITNESTEDTLAFTDDLRDAVRLAIEAAGQGPTGELVCVEQEGMTIKQFLLLPDGTVEEQPIAQSGNPRPL